jgi:3-deoxy-D-manno-octulosonic-acid transferase
MIRYPYNLLMLALVPLLRRRLAKRGVMESGYLVAVEERFGRYPDVPQGGFVWVHAVSLGETRAAAVLIARLRAQLPSMRLLLTHGTATGRAEGKKLLRPGDVQVWQPWDTIGVVKRFLAHFKPRIGLLIETEIWPNITAECQLAGVPLVLVNARMSEKSLKESLNLSWLARPAFSALTTTWAQTQADAQRLVALGAPVGGVFGNLKFDAQPNTEQLDLGRAWRQALGRPVVLLASSREGEELALLEILSSFRPSAQDGQAIPAINFEALNSQWLIVPRHPQRFNAVAELIESFGFRVSRRSTWVSGPPELEDDANHEDVSDASVPTIWLGDSLGEMALYYGLADLALLGGSFEPLGGQNLIEAAACACPVVMGPHTYNFKEAAELAEAAGAAGRVANLTEAFKVAQALVGDAHARGAMVSAATEFSSAHRGAVEKTAAAVLALLGEQGVDAT